MTHKPRKKCPNRNIKKVMFCLECVLVLKSDRYFPVVNVQTHPMVNVATHLDNVQCLDSHHEHITAPFCFKHT